MKKLFLLGAMVCTLGMMTACKSDNKNNNTMNSHTDLYDDGERDRSGANDNKEGNYIPWDTLEEFFKTNL